MEMAAWLALAVTVGLVLVASLVLWGISFGSRIVQRWGDHSVRGPHGRDS